MNTRSLNTRLLVVLLLGSVALNVLLARNVAGLRASIAYLKAEMKTLQGIKVGELVPPIDATDIHGSPKSIGYNDGRSPTVVYAFTPDCIWCVRNLDAIKSLAGQLEPGHRLIGLSLSKENIKSYLAENDIRFPVYIESHVAGRSAYRAGGTPRTLVVSSEGRLIKEWFGAYGGDVKTGDRGVLWG